jgi:L,D-transpeptidase YbiS
MHARTAHRGPVIPPNGCLLTVSVRSQMLGLWRGGRLLREYPISTSRAGVGSRVNSHRTPPGWHRVVRWIGGNKPLGSVFRSRRATGQVLKPSAWRGGSATDLILSRILRLRGLEPGRNAGPGCDSYARYIYIHGTNQEHALGEPASHGCVRMGNKDVADLFRRTRGHPTWCLITAD